MLHIRDVEGPKKTGSVDTRLEAMEQQVFKCQGMVERGLNANHMMITEFTNNHKMDAIDIGKHLSRLYDRVDQLQGQIYDPQNQNCAAADPAEIHGILNYENHFSVASLDSGPISTLINEPAEWFLLLMPEVGDNRVLPLMEEDGSLKRPRKHLLPILFRIKSLW
ncbi:40S ribosomal protein S5-1 [Hordeum vulgare]|nr:40S ribosomal protein S5-1 [Hordeum vulgare]